MPYKKRRHKAPAGTRTVGLSNKVASTLWGACGAQAVAFLVNLIATGDFDRVELAQLVGVGLTAAGGLLAGALASPDAQSRRMPD